MRRLHLRCRWLTWPLTVALLLAVTLQGVVHSAAPGSALAEICTAGGTVSLAVPGGKEDGAAPGPMCLLCLSTVQAWTLAGEAAPSLVSPARVARDGFRPGPAFVASRLVWHAAPRGPPSAS